MMPCESRTKASRRFSMSGMITSWLTIGFGGSAGVAPAPGRRRGRARTARRRRRDGVRGFGGDDPGLGEPDVPPAHDALLGVADGGALHGALHGARTAA